MKYEHKTIVVTAAVALVIRKLAQLLDRDETDGMFVVGLSPSGKLPATHYISSGQVPSVFLEAMANATTLHLKAIDACALEGITMPFSQLAVTTALLGCAIGTGKASVVIDGVPTIIDEGPHEMIARLNLKLVR